MDEPRTVPSIAAAETEAFFAEGRQSWPPENSDPAQCCVGVDVPGLGRQHSFDCGLAGRVASLAGKLYVAGEVSPGLAAALDGERSGLTIASQLDLADLRSLAKAINDRGVEIYDDISGDGDLGSASADAKDLLRAFARVLCGETLRAAFGAPGDWGYNTAIGSSLAKIYERGGAGLTGFAQNGGAR